MGHDMKGTTLAIIAVSAVLLTILLLAPLASFFYGCETGNSFEDCESGEYPVTEKYSDYKESRDIPLTPEEQKIKICEEVAQQYYETHTYIQNDVFDCDNMACDVWNILKTKGINAKIVVGNIDLEEYGIEDWNHAWIIAEVSPNTWLAIECTSGCVVYRWDNPRYYYGHFFSNPKSLRDFNQLYREYQIQSNAYSNAIDFYNAIVDEYNNANYFTQLSLKSGLQVAKFEMEQKERDFYTTKTKLEAVLEYG